MVILPAVSIHCLCHGRSNGIARLVFPLEFHASFRGKSNKKLVKGLRKLKFTGQLKRAVFSDRPDSMIFYVAGHYGGKYLSQYYNEFVNWE